MCVPNFVPICLAVETVLVKPPSVNKCQPTAGRAKNISTSSYCLLNKMKLIRQTDMDCNNETGLC